MGNYFIDSHRDSRHSRLQGALIARATGGGGRPASHHVVRPLMNQPSPPWSRLVAIVAGMAVATLGLVVVVGWHLRSHAILQPFPGMIAPVYNTALSFVLCGAGLLAISLGRPTLAIPCGVVPGIVAVLNLIQHAFGLELGIDQLLMEHSINTLTAHPGRLAPNTAVCFFLAAIALLLEGTHALGWRRPALVGLFGSIIAALGTVAISGYLLGLKTYGWGRLLPMAPHTAIGVAVLGVGVMATVWGEGRSQASKAPRWLPIPVGVGVLTATLCLWQPLVAQGHAQIDRTADAEVVGAKKAIIAELDARVFPLTRMAKRWERRGKPSREVWELDAEIIVSHYADLQAVEWIDPEWRCRWVVPAEGNESDRDRDVAKEPRHRQALIDARDRREVRLLRGDATASGGAVLWVVVPIFTSRGFEGFILGIVRLRDFFASILTEDVAPGYAITVSDGDEEIYGRDTEGRSLAEEWGREKKVDSYSVGWQVRVWPLPEHLSQSRSLVPEAVMGVGGLLAMLLSWAVHLAQMSRIRTLEVESVNDQLGREVSDRSKAQDSLSRTTENLGRTLETIREAVLNLSSTSAELLASTSQQASGLQEQAAAVTETVATVNQVADSSEQAAQRAKGVGDAIRRTLEIGNAGRQAVEDSAAALGMVKEQVEATAREILMLSEHAQAIAEIIATVNVMAEETNILALNAAIEASRAGEHGKGFAVVAREVKVLADQSKTATVKVRQILGEIQKATNRSVVSTEEMTGGVASAIRVGVQAGGAIKALAETLDATTRAVTQIIAASTQQATAMSQVNLAMKDIEQIERRNDMAIRQFEQAARDLNTLSTRLAALAAT